MRGTWHKSLVLILALILVQPGCCCTLFDFVDAQDNETCCPCCPSESESDTPTDASCCENDRELILAERTNLNQPQPDNDDSVEPPSTGPPFATPAAFTPYLRAALVPDPAQPPLSSSRRRALISVYRL